MEKRVRKMALMVDIGTTTTGAAFRANEATIGVQELAERFGYGRKWVYANLAAGTLPVRPVPLPGRKIRFLKSDVDRYLSSTLRKRA